SPEVEVLRDALRADDGAAALVVAIDVIAAVAVAVLSRAKNCRRRILELVDSVFIVCALNC
ncbi:MAG: hypothetical protein ACP5MD_05855, partial [Verrucomicrobiia bacterium]